VRSHSPRRSGTPSCHATSQNPQDSRHFDLRHPSGPRARPAHVRLRQAQDHRQRQRPELTSNAILRWTDDHTRSSGITSHRASRFKTPSAESSSVALRDELEISATAVVADVGRPQQTLRERRQFRSCEICPWSATSRRCCRNARNRPIFKLGQC
jgi:hypothetical protein